MKTFIQGAIVGIVVYLVLLLDGHLSFRPPAPVSTPVVVQYEVVERLIERCERIVVVEVYVPTLRCAPGDGVRQWADGPNVMAECVEKGPMEKEGESR